jgi:hypothetical protein
MASDVTVAPTLGHAVLVTQGGIGATPGYDAIDLRRMIQAASSGQSGVFDATGWKVTEATAGANMTVLVDANAGIARVDGTSVTHQGPYIVAPHSADITLDVATAHATNPRIDMVILQVRDHTHDASGSNDARVRILTGTATGGATLDNRTGQAALPPNSIRLADVLVPAADTTISNAQIRDRRQWARGVYWHTIRNQDEGGGTDYTTTSISAVAIDATNLATRVECSGAPLRVRLTGRAANTAGGNETNFAATIDGVVQDGGAQLIFGASGANTVAPISFVYDVIPSAGSRLIAMYWNVSAGTATLYARSTMPVQMTIEEIVGRPDASNA